MRVRRWARVVLVAAVVAAALPVAVYVIGWLRQGGNPRRLVKDIPHERLEYSVTSWLGESGTIDVDVSPLLVLGDGRRAYRFTYTVATTRAVSAVFVLKGQVSVLVDAGTLLPIEYEELVTSGLGVTGGTERHARLAYDQTSHVVTFYRERDSRGSLEFVRARIIPPCTQHFSSFIYYLRDVKLEVGKEISAVMSDRRRDTLMTAKVLGEEMVESKAGGPRACVVIGSTSDFAKDEMKGSTFVIWLDKAERYPVRIDAKTKWGTISARLVRRTLVEDAPAHRSVAVEGR